MDAAGQSFLELNTVDKKSQLRYDSSLRSFLVSAGEKFLALTTGTECLTRALLDQQLPPLVAARKIA